MSSAGRAVNSNGFAATPKEREIGLSGFAVPIRLSSLTGSYGIATAEHREPCKSRGSSTVLGAPGGEIPPGDSTIANGRSVSSTGVTPVLAAKARQIVASCGSSIVSAGSPSRGVRSDRPTGRAVDIEGNPGCVYAQLKGWPGGYSTDDSGHRPCPYQLQSRRPGVGPALCARHPRPRHEALRQSSRQSWRQSVTPEQAPPVTRCSRTSMSVRCTPLIDLWTAYAGPAAVGFGRLATGLAVTRGLRELRGNLTCVDKSLICSHPNG